MKSLGEKIREVLKETKHISDADILKALNLYAKEPKGRLRDVFVRMGLLSEKEILSLLNVELKMPLVSLAERKINPFIARSIPEKEARKHSIIALSKVGDTLTLAMADPFNILALEGEALFKKMTLDCVISGEKEIEETLQRIYRSEPKVVSSPGLKGMTMPTGAKKETEGDFAYVLGDISAAPIVKLVDGILNEALKRRASDVHIEPFENTVRVRYRIDGNLEEAEPIPKKNQNAILTRIKILSRLDITENRLPQDGRFKIRVRDREVDLRVSILPVHFGNKVVMRILDKGALTVGLDHLGFLPESLEMFKSAVVKPFGMILITGPTGSGKSTTLYSILNQLNTPEKNIITIEDPIEYQVAGITQIQTKPEIGLDFANGLRAILRQSPDIVMVGEIRDSETADIAIKASLTGQLVLSTLHTNDAAGAMTRLVDMGIEPFLIASSVILVAAQRLCRTICPDCKEKVEIPKEVFQRMNVAIEKIASQVGKRDFYKGKGCDKCNKTGYYGRLGILETIWIDDTIRDLIVKRASSFEIKDYALKAGMVSLRDDALKKFCLGLTTLDEVIRVTSEDE
ncbi:MAG: type II/IV secretion system protein [Candidatus Omnitrophica bacterium]|nr:type II/IV secretion system protein [Candidatus Omnitrophota bacterium]